MTDDDQPFTVRVPEDIAEMTDDDLLAELETLVAHEDADVLTTDQRTYLGNIRDEMYKRMSTGGPYGDYEGGPTDE